MNINLEKLGEEFAARARKAQGEIRKSIRASLTDLETAKLILHDELDAIEKERQELSKRVEAAWEVFGQAALEHSASLRAVSMQLGEPSNVAKIEDKKKGAA